MATAAINAQPSNRISNPFGSPPGHLCWAVHQDVFVDSWTWATQVGEALDRVEEDWRLQLVSVNDSKDELADDDITRLTLASRPDGLQDNQAYLFQQVLALREIVRRMAEW